MLVSLYKANEFIGIMNYPLSPAQVSIPVSRGSVELTGLISRILGVLALPGSGPVPYSGG